MAKRKKKLENNVQDEIKRMESEMREKSIKEAKPIIKADEPVKIAFETWYFMRSKSIPSRHAKEIIIVDFKARGLKEKETVEIFDEALRKYGIEL